MKNARFLIFWLFFLQAAGLTGQDAAPNDTLARLLREADEIRVVQVDNIDEYTACQCAVPAGKQALAQAFADATMPLHRGPGSEKWGQAT